MQTNSSPSRLVALLSVAFLVGVGCASAVYWLFVAPSGGSEQTADTVVAPPSLAEIEPSTRVESSPTEVSNVPAQPKSSVRSLDEIASMKSASEQQLALRVHLSGLDEEQVAELLTQSQDVFEDPDRFDLQFAMVQRLAHQNPNRALSLVLEMDSSPILVRFVTSIFGDWAHSNLDEAVSRAGRLKPHFKRTALSAIVQERTDLSDDTIRAIARDLDNEQIATSAIAQRKIDEAIDDPETAWNELAIELQDDPDNSRTISRVATAWVEKSGLSVLDQIYESLTNTQVRQDVIRNVLAEVAQTDPNGAFNYAATMNDQYNTVVRVVVGIWASSDPRSALSAAIAVKKTSVRKAVAEEIVRAWARRDHSATLEWILNEPGVEEIRSDLLYSIIYTLIEADPQLAMTTALAQPIEESDTGIGMSGHWELGMEFTVISALAYSDVEKAIELLPQVREGPTRFRAFERVAQSLLRNGEIDEAFNIAQQVPDSDREHFYLVLTTGWAGSDPVGMLDSMNRFPSEDAMSRAALLLVMSNSTTKTLSDEQVEEAKKYISEEHARALKEGDVDFLQSLILGN